MTAFAVVVTYLPDTEQCFSTPFSAPHFDDPLTMAHLFCESEEERGDFPGSWVQAVGNFSGVAEARDAMGMPWANRDGLREAIPPAYTKHIGRQLLAAIDTTEAAP